jgi:hypothetical protein
VPMSSDLIADGAPSRTNKTGRIMFVEYFDFPHYASFPAAMMRLVLTQYIPKGRKKNIVRAFLLEADQPILLKPPKRRRRFSDYQFVTISIPEVSETLFARAFHEGDLFSVMQSTAEIGRIRSAKFGHARRTQTQI